MSWSECETFQCADVDARKKSLGVEDIYLAGESKGLISFVSRDSIEMTIMF